MSVAKGHIAEALEICHELGDERQEGVLLRLTAELLRERGDYVAALPLLDRANAIHASRQDLPELCAVLCITGATHKAHGRLAEASSAFDAAITLLRISAHRRRPFQPIVDGISDERRRRFRPSWTAFQRDRGRSGVARVT